MVTGHFKSSIPGEGRITFDIRFYMVTKDGLRIKIIVNIELQKKYHQIYHYEQRAVFYSARMISEQLNRELRKRHLRRVSLGISQGISQGEKSKKVTTGLCSGGNFRIVLAVATFPFHDISFVA